MRNLRCGHLLPNPSISSYKGFLPCPVVADMFVLTVRIGHGRDVSGLKVSSQTST